MLQAAYTPPGASASVTEPATYAYDEDGNLLAQADPAGNTTSYTYDALGDETSMTLPVGIKMFMQQYQSDWGSLMAAATVTVMPTFVLFLAIQRYITYGAVAGGVKG